MRLKRMGRFGCFVVGVSMSGGCATEVASPESGPGIAEGELRRGSGVAFEEFIDPAGVGDAASRETRVLITRAAQYRHILGHDAPKEIDFRRGDAVVFYGAGVQPTGGYEASIVDIVRGRTGLVVTTRLVSPGPRCLVTMALTEPFVLVKLHAPGVQRGVDFVRSDMVRDCDQPSCEGVVCPAGEHCELRQVVCITTPCDPVPTCAPDGGTGAMCGGIAGIPCPGEGTCVDDPSDSCDPNRGGADCSGLCTCTTTRPCATGEVFDSSAAVCACVPDPSLDPTASPCAAVLCPAGSRCEVYEQSPVCVSDGTMACGAGICAAGSVCCNASCGICTPPDGACIQIACVGSET